MNWKTEAIERLQRYDAMRQAQVNLPEEMKRLEMEVHSLRSGNIEAMPAKSGKCRLEDMLLSNLIHREELADALDQVGRWLRITDRALAALTPEEKLVLHRLYIYPERGSVDRLCGDLNVEQSSIYRKREKALRKFTYALYGIAEN